MEDIIEHMNVWLKNRLASHDKVKHLETIKEICERKRNYLLKLLLLATKQDCLKGELKSYHLNIEANAEEPLFLNSKRLYSIKKKEYWGDFWMVSFDPCHRQLTNYLMIYENIYKSFCPLDFLLWLENQHVPIGQPYEDYLTEQEAQQYQIVIESQKLRYFHETSFLNCCSDKKYIYVIDVRKNLYIAEETKNMFHSCFVQGKPVLSAGKIKVVSGKITEVSFESGHYFPSIKTGYRLFTYLIENDYQFNESISVSYFYDRNKYTATIQPEFLNHLKDFEGNLLQR